MAAVKELLVNRFVTSAAIRRSHLEVNHEPVVIGSPLSRRDLMAVQTIDAFASMSAHLEFVDDGVMRVEMALRALAAGSDESGARLFDDHPRPS